MIFTLFTRPVKRIFARFMTLMLSLGMVGILPINPVSAQVLPITPDVVANGPEQFRIEVQKAEYERWGMPRDGCKGFDDSHPMRKFTVSIRLTNTSAQAITELGIKFFNGNSDALGNCVYYYAGITNDLLPGQSREITLVGFVEENQSISKLVVSSPQSARAICFNDRTVVGCAGSSASVSNNQNGQVVRVANPSAAIQPKYEYVGVARPDATVSATEARAGYIDLHVNSAVYETTGRPTANCNTLDPQRIARKFTVSMRIANLSERATEGWAIIPILRDGKRPIRMCNYGTALAPDIPAGNAFQANFAIYIENNNSVSGVMVYTDVGFQIVCFDGNGQLRECLKDEKIGPAIGTSPTKLLTDLRIGYAKTDLLKTQYLQNVKPKVRDCVSYSIDATVTTKVLVTVRITNQSNIPLSGLSAQITTDGDHSYFACPQFARSGDIPAIPPNSSRVIVLEGFVTKGEHVKNIIVSTDVGLEGLCIERDAKVNCFKK